MLELFRVTRPVMEIPASLAQNHYGDQTAVKTNSVPYATLDTTKKRGIETGAVLVPLMSNQALHYLRQPDGIDISKHNVDLI